jgi:hypothetical protein
MYATDEPSFGLRGSTALGRAWTAKIGDHLPYGQLVLLAVATLCDQSALCTRDPDGVRAEVATMTGLEAWKVSEVMRLLVRDGHLLEADGHLIVA